MEKLDYKKAYKHLYLPKAVPTLIDVPEMTFIMVDGKGDPNGDEYADAVSLLYSLSYTLKMKGKAFDQYTEYVIFPLEGFWWVEDGTYDFYNREKWGWISLIRQPDFVTADVFAWAVDLCQKKNPEQDYSKARLQTITEGLCVQMMHYGPFVDEPATVAQMNQFIEHNGLVTTLGKDERQHHEIYLSDPRKTAPEKLKTVIRHPVAKV